MAADSELCVYTALFGQNGDDLSEPGYRGSGVRYIAYTDRYPSGRYYRGWECYAVFNLERTGRRTARRIKTLMPRLLCAEHEYSLWVDASFAIVDDPRCLIDQYLQDSDIATFKHSQRDCVYEEAEACKRLRKDSPAVIDRQMARYRAAGYPEHAGLAETGVMLRRHTAAVDRLCNRWWYEIDRGSVRDQLSFPFAIRNLKYATFDGTYTTFPHFVFRPHNRRARPASKG